MKQQSVRCERVRPRSCARAYQVHVKNIPVGCKVVMVEFAVKHSEGPQLVVLIRKMALFINKRFSASRKVADLYPS